MSNNLKTYYKESREGLIAAQGGLTSVVSGLRNLVGVSDLSPLAKIEFDNIIKNLQEMSKTLTAMQVDLRETLPRLMSHGEVEIQGTVLQVNQPMFPDLVDESNVREIILDNLDEKISEEMCQPS